MADNADNKGKGKATKPDVNEKKEMTDTKRKGKMSEAENNPAPRSNPNLVPEPPSFHPTILGWGKPTFLFKLNLGYGEIESQPPRLAMLMENEHRVLDFMTEAEKNRVENNTGKYGSISVHTREAISAKKEYILELERARRKSINHVLMFEKGWETILEDHWLIWKYGDSIQGWGFRKEDGKFRMALQHIGKPRDPDAVGNITTSSPAGNKRNRGMMEPDINDPPLFHQTIAADFHPVSLFTKELEYEDCRGVKQLNIKNVEALMKFMNREEKASLYTRNSGLRVVAREAESALKSYALSLAKVGSALVFRHGWSQFVDDFDLKIGDSVHGWGYRSTSATGEFHLALKIARKEFDKKQTLKTGLSIKDPVKKRSTIMLDNPPPTNIKKTATKKR